MLGVHTEVGGDVVAVVSERDAEELALAFTHTRDVRLAFATARGHEIDLFPGIVDGLVMARGASVHGLATVALGSSPELWSFELDAEGHLERARVDVAPYPPRASLALDGADVAHACWVGPGGALRYSANVGEDAPATLVAEVTDCAIALAERPLIVAGVPRDGGTELVEIVVGGSGARPIGVGYAPALSLAPDGAAWLASVEPRDGRAILSLRERSSDGRWIARELSLPPLGDAGASARVSLAIDGRSRAHVMALVGGSLVYVRRSADGHVVADALGTVDGASMALGADDEPRVAFLRGAESVVWARRVPDEACDVGRTRIEGVCCWPGQTASNGACQGVPECPRSFFAEDRACERVEPEAELAVAQCGAPVVFGEQPIQRTLGRADCLELADTLQYAAYRCARGEAAGCYAEGATRSGVRLSSYEVVAAVAECAPERTCTSLLTRVVTNPIEAYTESGDIAPVDTRAEDADIARAVLDRACTLGHADACVMLALPDGEEVHQDELSRACEAGVIPACGHHVFLNRDRPSRTHVARLQRACASGDALACAYVANVAEPGERVAMLELACGVEADLPRDPEVEDDPATWHDDRRDPYGSWSDEARRRYAACYALAYAASRDRRVRVPRTSAMRGVLEAVCTGEEEILGTPCLLLAELLERGIGGSRDRRRASDAHLAACERAETTEGCEE